MTMSLQIAAPASGLRLTSSIGPCEANWGEGMFPNSLIYLLIVLPRLF